MANKTYKLLKRIKRIIFKPKIVFIVQYSFIFSSYYSLYKQFLESKKILPYVCIIPNADNRFDNKEILDIQNSIFDTFEIKNCFVDYDGSNLKAISPDIVFLQTPYDSQRPDEFHIENLSKEYKVCYIPYGIGLADCPHFHYGLDFFKFCWKIFLEAPISLQMASDYLGQEKFILYEGKYEITGSPKIEMLLNYNNHIGNSENLWKLPKSKQTKRVIWAPHWTFDWKLSGDGISRNGYSTFMLYYKFFLEFARNNPNIDLVIRAHPLTFSEITTRNLLSIEELEEYKNEINSLPNARIDGESKAGDFYFDLFFSSDAMITDGISFFTEYPITNKPLLHTLGNDNPAKLNKYGERITKAFYKAYNIQDIESFLKDVVFGENDVLKKERLRIFNEEIYIPINGISKTILDIIVKSL